MGAHDSAAHMRRNRWFGRFMRASSHQLALNSRPRMRRSALITVAFDGLQKVHERHLQKLQCVLENVALQKSSHISNDVSRLFLPLAGAFGVHGIRAIPAMALHDFAVKSRARSSHDTRPFR